MRKKLSLKIPKLDNKIKKIMKYGFLFCGFLLTVSTLVLLTYHFSPTSIEIYNVGISLFQTSFLFALDFLICGLAFNKIKNELQI